jgi:predicted tellurium resistance membrane protein TerC
MFGLTLSIIIMATLANFISIYIKKFKWIAWIGLFAILFVAAELIYEDSIVLIAKYF